MDWLTSIWLPLAGIAASVFIGIASLRLAGAANRISERAATAEAQREAREGRARFVGHLLHWTDVVWSGEKGVEHAEAQMQASLRVKSSSLAEPGLDPEAAGKIVDAAHRARSIVEAMRPIERRAIGPGVKGSVATLGHALIAFPDGIEASLAEFHRRLDVFEREAADGRAREELRDVLRGTTGPDGKPRTDEEIEGLLDSFEASLREAS